MGWSGPGDLLCNVRVVAVVNSHQSADSHAPRAGCSREEPGAPIPKPDDAGIRAVEEGGSTGCVISALRNLGVPIARLRAARGSAGAPGRLLSSEQPSSAAAHGANAMTTALEARQNAGTARSRRVDMTAAWGSPTEGTSAEREISAQGRRFSGADRWACGGSARAGAPADDATVDEA